MPTYSHNHRVLQLRHLQIKIKEKSIIEQKPHISNCDASRRFELFTGVIATVLWWTRWQLHACKTVAGGNTCKSSGGRRIGHPVLKGLKLANNHFIISKSFAINHTEQGFLMCAGVV
jgi:hypothetical protein